MADDRRRSTPTPDVCPACGGDKRPSCRCCGGLGFASRAQIQRYEEERRQRLTGQFAQYEEILESLVRSLGQRHADAKLVRAHADATIFGRLLEEGERLQREFAEVKHLEQGDKRRSEAVIKMLDFNKRGLYAISGGR